MSSFKPVIALLLIALALVSAGISNRCRGVNDCPKGISAMAVTSDGILLVASGHSMITPSSLNDPFRYSFIYGTRTYYDWSIFTDSRDQIEISSLAAHPEGPVVAAGTPSQPRSEASVHYSNDPELQGFRSIEVTNGMVSRDARPVRGTPDMIGMISTSADGGNFSGPFLRLKNKGPSSNGYPFLSFISGPSGEVFNHIELPSAGDLGYPLVASFPSSQRFFLTRAPYKAPGDKPLSEGGVWRSTNQGMKWEGVRFTGKSEQVTAMDCYDEDICVFAMKTSNGVVIEGTRNGGGKWVVLYTENKVERADYKPLHLRMLSPYAVAVALESPSVSQESVVIGCEDVFGSGVWDIGSLGKASKVTAVVPRPDLQAVLVSVVDANKETSRIYDFEFVV